jgi:hypothetical protein
MSSSMNENDQRNAVSGVPVKKTLKEEQASRRAKNKVVKKSLNKKQVGLETKKRKNTEVES